MNKTNNQPPKNPRNKRQRRITLVAFVVLLPLVIALWTPVPAEFFLRYSLGNMLNAHVQVEVVQTFGTLHIKELTLSEKSASTTPALLIENLFIDYRFWPSNGRLITALSATNLSLTLQSDAEGNTNYQFLIDFLTAPTSEMDPMLVLPEQSSVENVALTIQTPESTLALDGIKAQASIRTEDEINIEITADTQLAWSMSALEPTPNVSEGHANLSLAFSNGNLETTGDIAFPGLVTFNASLNATLTDQLESLTSNIADASLQGPLWGELFGTFVGMPIAFERFSLRNTTLEVDNFGRVDSTFGGHLEATCDALSVGLETEAWYNGDLALKIDGTVQEESFLTLTVLPHNGQTLLATLQGTTDDLKLSVMLHEWTKEDIVALTPTSLKWMLDESTTLRTLSAQINGTWKAGGYTLDGQITPTLDTEQLKADLEAKGHFFSMTDPLFDGTLDIVHQPVRAQGNNLTTGGSLAIHGLIQSAEAFTLEIRPDRLDASKWFQTWTGTPLPESANAILAGPLTVAANQDMPYEFTFDLAASDIVYGETALSSGDALMLAGRGTFAHNTAEAQGTFLEAKFNNYNYLRLDNWSLSKEPAAIATQLTGIIDLATVSPLFGSDEWWGELTIEALITTDIAGHTHIPLVMTADTLGYGDLYTPYGETLELNGNFDLDPKSKSLTADIVTITLGDGTRLALNELNAQSSSETDSSNIAIAAANFSTDLRPLVTKGYLLEAQGIATLAASDLLYSTTNGLDGQIRFTLDAPYLTLADNLAAFTDVHVDGHSTDLSRGKAVASIQSSEMLAGGATFKALHGTLNLADGLLTSDNLGANVFDGNFAGALEINVLDDKMPVHTEINLDGIDLARFTEEFDPPSVKLTGLAYAALSIDFDVDNISDYTASISALQDFTLNRDLILSLVGEMTNTPLLGASILRAIGKADQRPFGRAELSLHHQDGSIKLEGILQDTDKKVKQKLNIPIAINFLGDIGDLISLLQLQQNERIQK